MTSETLDLFRAIHSADVFRVQRALAAGADVNALDYKGRNVVSHAALGDAIDAIHTPIQPQLSEHGLEILQLLLEHPDLTLYSLNAPLPWAGGVTLLGLMSWLNMPTEIMCLLEFAQCLVEVNAMDEQGATPLMYAARDGNLEVVQRLLAHGARPEFRDTSQRSTIQYALPHPQVLWLCEDNLRRSRESEPLSPVSPTPSARGALLTSFTSTLHHPLFVATPLQTLLAPPPLEHFDATDLRRSFDNLLCAIRNGDVDTLNTLLFSRDSFGQEKGSGAQKTQFLVNLRDSSGLALVHHAVSQRSGPRMAVLDALYRAGADMGLFSTLGFTPLHHLARTARADSRHVSHERETSRPSLTTNTHPLYAFTTHLVRRLHAPLGAADGKGETPIHAAAEHGQSASVLQAMLDCDARFAGNEAVRETLNQRGLKPVDLAKPEFSPLFARDQQMSVHTPSQARPPDDQHRQRQDSIPRTPFSTSSGRPSSSGLLLSKKGSSASLRSRSSSSSTTSSGMQQSPGSHSLNKSRLLYQSTPPHKPVTPIHTLPTPEPTPPAQQPVALPEVLGPFASSIDVDACAVDVLSNLALSASALHAYSQQHPFRYEMDIASLPDLPMLSEALLFTRDLASHVLAHWAAKLQLAQREFERVRQELQKAGDLRERVGRAIGKMAQGGAERGEGAKVAQKEEKTERAGSTPRQGAERDRSSAMRAGTQIDSEDDTLVPFPSRMDEPVEWDPRKSKQVYLKEAGGEREDLSAREPQALETVTSVDAIQSAPRVLQRTANDFHGVLAQIAQANQSFMRAQQSVEEARILVEQAVKSREVKLNALIRIHHHQDLPPASSRLSPILERSPDSPPDSTRPHPQSLAQASSSPSANLHYLMAAPIEEPHELRRFLTRRLARHVDCVFDDLQKVHVWLRIIREVLRGLRKRVGIER